MLCLFHNETHPAFNLAAEEYMLRSVDHNVFMLWRNANAVIVGKHQNTLAEINAEFVDKHNVQVIRRLSGGGAVFHDLGNLNFTFIMKSDEERRVDFKKYTRPILEVMEQLGVPARFEGRNDLTINGLKFSGNAEHVWKNRVLHHGTLLFSSELSHLAGALKSNPEKFHDKGVKSVRSRVTNISDHLKEPMDVLTFGNKIMQHVQSIYLDARTYHFSESDVNAIRTLQKEKYETWEWNYGYSPKYNFVQSKRSSAGTIELRMYVEKGVIQDLIFYGDFFGQRDPATLKELFRGKRHGRTEIKQVVDEISVDLYFSGATPDDVVDLFF